MRIRYGMLCIFAAALLLLCGCSSSLRTRPGVTVPPVATAAYTETPATDIVLTDANGNEMHLFDHLGTPVLLQFWPEGTAIAEENVAAVRRAYDDCGKDVMFLVVCTVSHADALTEAGLASLVHFDTDGAAARAYDIDQSPVTIFIDADGFIATQSVGTISEEVLLFGLKML